VSAIGRQQVPANCQEAAATAAAVAAAAVDPPALQQCSCSAAAPKQQHLQLTFELQLAIPAVMAAPPFPLNLLHCSCLFFEYVICMHC
jgi:hypothetical protein